MYRMLKAMLNAMTENGDDGQELVEGGVRALREFVIEAYGQTGSELQTELERLGKMLAGQIQ